LSVERAADAATEQRCNPTRRLWPGRFVSQARSD
jgi:hypothetical protein